MVESMFIINQVLHLIPTGPVHTQDFKYFGNPRIKMKSSMEYLINHFKLYSEHYSIGASDIYQAVEAPKGEFGIYLVTDNTNHPMRCKIKAPGFYHLQALNGMSHNHLLADLVTIIGTQDIVFGEIDR